MSANNKVIWSEGMFLRPQHFQQQDRYLENLLEARTESLGPYTWGIIELAIDSEPLSLGKISLSRVKAIFPDGTPMLAPENELLPDVLDVPVNTRDEIVFLCIPLKRPGSQESVRDQEDFPQARYQASNFDARNSASSSGESARIQVGKLRVCLKLESDDRSGYASIGIARIRERQPEKPVELDSDYIPPLLNAEASAVIKAYIEEIKGLLDHRGSALGHRLSDSGRSGSAEIADYLLLQVINRFEPLLRQLTAQPRLHPHSLFLELLQLAGELATFTSPNKRPPEIPAYIHENLQQSYAGLFSALRQSLSTVLEQTAIALELVQRKFGIYVAPVTDPSLLSTASFVMAAKADMPGDLLRSRFPGQAKVAPVEAIRELISAQLPGLSLRPLPVAPRQIPYHAGFAYFELERTGDLWRAMQKSGGFAVHLGAEFPGLVMELWAIRNN
ncbi:type VI secretion system baseplate subunit TssK [Microbulbifer thermotolerans]|uniref:Type VI secretion protein n=1 Tax=Microbulbifer thermotolerans TaxID=252514 RepID=A0A143HI39_MICTH|nr:type VI secretion system baseplate subunit TssK [Microbulbifer thermotolerans]AMX01384.1 type VI secretion protein [Microbulbifer thermotolerans]MCX2780332.1 type VI secretion system baseplate subunit TssK [Microbulbifer thermotolerans]MCX2782795.1 type VI secretion system baseplate subunit TssK [Microbulbifer thermotolerans]MCX2795550.1 type VI secretion system baseplate subunit TssK [Microbulbifer thermotolerans]MCX2800263.1 type VI secretion system baseplate subunit TssK [Microbulbifer t